jgi:hypothetical protein
MSTSLAVLIVAQGSRHTQEAPDSGVGIGLIIGTVVLVILIAALIFFVFTRSTRASRGGVVSPDSERRQGEIGPVLADREPPAR